MYQILILKVTTLTFPLRCCLMKGCAVMKWSVAAGLCDASSRQHSATNEWKADVNVRERCDSISDSDD